MKDKYKEILPAVVAVILLYVLMGWVGITCPIKFITGISCAGCGMTRAWKALLHLDIKSAYAYHPGFWLPPVAVVIYLLRTKIPNVVYKVLMLTICGAFVIIYLIRIFDGDNNIVVFQPEKNIVFRLINLLMKKGGVTDVLF